MKLLLCAKSYYLADSSGETETIYNIYSYMKKKNIDVSICGANEEIDYGRYDIVHIFDIKNIFDTYKHFKLASRCRCRIVLSPMYCDMVEYFSRNDEEERINSWKNCSIYRNMVVNKSDLVLCGSRYEEELIRRDFNPGGEITIVYNGVEVSDNEVPLYNFKDRYNIDSYVLCVGRICKMKNQLILSRVCSELDIPLILAGKPEDLKYLKECIRYKTTRYLGFMNDYDLYNAYSFSNLYVSAGYMDTMAYSSLRAASYGCNIVAPGEGVAEEYFGDRIAYCNPYSFESIKKSVSENFFRQKDGKLKKYVIDNYSLDKSMEEIYLCYEKLLKESW